MVPPEASNDPDFQAAFAHLHNDPRIGRGKLGVTDLALATLAEVEGDVPVASAAWWGFDTEDSGGALAKAFNSKASTIIVPNMGRLWGIKHSLTLSRSINDKTILFQAGSGIYGEGDGIASHVPGQEDAWPMTNLALMYLFNVKNLRLQGEKYGHTRARFKLAGRSDEKNIGSAGPHAIRLDHCEDVHISGFKLTSHCADGIYVGGDGLLRGIRNGCNVNTTIEDVDCNSNARCGIAVISAESLTIRGSTIQNSGMAEGNVRNRSPLCGIDFEPNNRNQRIVDCEVRDCTFSNNNYSNISVSNYGLTRIDLPVTISIVNCDLQTPDKGESLAFRLSLNPMPAVDISIVPLRTSRSLFFGSRSRELGPSFRVLVSTLPNADIPQREISVNEHMPTDFAPVQFSVNSTSGFDQSTRIKITNHAS